MKTYQEEFIKFALKNNALRLGNFKLNSGRRSPYFFNAGRFTDGEALLKLGNYYASTIMEQVALDFDVIFGPAYKGIQIATSASMILSQRYNRKLPVSFNRKEVKDHGEGGLIVGASLKGKRVLLTDDVITAGTAISEAAEIIKNEGGILVGIVIAFDRQERGQQSQNSAIQEVERRLGVPVFSVIKRDHLIEFLAKQPKSKNQTRTLQALEEYKADYGAKEVIPEDTGVRLTIQAKL